MGKTKLFAIAVDTPFDSVKFGVMETDDVGDVRRDISAALNAEWGGACKVKPNAQAFEIKRGPELLKSKQSWAWWAADVKPKKKRKAVSGD